MSVTLNQFLSLLDKSGVISAEDVLNFQQSQDTSCETAIDLARLFVEHKKLTEFQIKMLLQCKGHRLVLGDYVILRELGVGGMGMVYLAEHRRMKREVALKMLPIRMIVDEEAIARFHREVHAAAKLTHTNIVTAYDAGEAKDIHYFVMEYVEGIDLSNLVKKYGFLQVDVAVNYITQAAKGLEFAHSRGVIHRDIKPANLLLDNTGIVKILDMGLARINNSGLNEDTFTQLTQSDSIMGTADYMAPEQAHNTHTADARSDIYSLGGTLFFLLTGEAMYRGDSFVSKVIAHLEQPVPSLVQKRPEVPEELDTIFLKMVSKNPADRYSNISELIDDLQAIKIDDQNPEHVSEKENRFKNLNLRNPLAKEDLSIIFSKYFEEDSFTEYIDTPISITDMKPKKRSRFLWWALALIGISVLWWTLSINHIFLAPPLFFSKTFQDVPEKTNLVTNSKNTVPDIDRKATKRVLELGGVIELVVNGQSREVQKMQAIPDHDFQIQKIILHGNQSVRDEDLKLFSFLENLEVLDLYHTNISDIGIQNLQHLPSLIKIDLYHTLVGDAGLDHLSQFRTLQSLSVHHTAVSNEGLKSLEDCSKLNSLNLANTVIDDSGLAYLKNLTDLQWLQISFTNVTDAGLMELRNLANLRDLYLKKTQVTSDGIKSLKLAIPECQIEQ